MAPDAQNFATFLTALLKARGLSQRQAAIRLNVAESQVSRWQRGQGGISLDSVERIAETFGVDRDFLAQLAGLRDSPSAITEDGVDPEMAALIDADRAELRDEFRDIPQIYWPAILQARRFATRSAIEIARMASTPQDINQPETKDISSPPEPPTKLREPRQPGKRGGLRRRFDGAWGDNHFDNALAVALP